MVVLRSEQCGPWVIPALRYERESATINVAVFGLIGNSITTSKAGSRKTAAWKVTIAEAVRQARGPDKWPLTGTCAVTLGLSFHLASHGQQPLDIENYLKPAFDAVACGLFIATDHDLSTIARWHFDDSRFVHILVHRLPDAASQSSEGAALLITCGAES
jgi:hypothetical protein